ncbi:MAG: hypothetical protein NTW03_08555, partial [Verrucomicrobia bacterium]|nr:hypothetical protein [Verrucomicrobiota bacterium]
MLVKREITSGDPLFLGVECGGTHTVALLANDRAETVQRLEAGPANPRLLSDRQLGAHFRKLASSLPKPAALGIGMPGVQDEKERSRIRFAASQAWPDIPCWIGSDLETALAAAGSSRTNVCRVIIISGTGSCCYGRNPAGATVKAGGWGHVIGDRGSAYDISRRALRMIMERFDQSGQWPALGAQLLQSVLLNSPNDLVTWAQNASKAGLAALAKEVLQAAQRGDPIARKVTRQAAETLAKDAAACAAQLARRRAPVEFLLSGSVLLKQPS